MSTTVATAPQVMRSVQIAWIVAGVVVGVGMTFGLAALDGGTVTDGTSTKTPATAVGVATLCYLAAAAIGHRWVAWVGVPVFSALAFVGMLDVLPWWALFALAGLVLVLVGLVRGASRVTGWQAVAMVAYFGSTLVALGLAPRLGLALAALALATHAFWDVRHYRRDVVVHRSLALLCIGLDVTVGSICLVVALSG